MVQLSVKFNTRKLGDCTFYWALISHAQECLKRWYFCILCNDVLLQLENLFMTTEEFYVFPLLNRQFLVEILNIKVSCRLPKTINTKMCLKLCIELFECLFSSNLRELEEEKRTI